MKGTLTALFALLVTLPLSVAAALDVQPMAITAPEKISMKDDLGKENPKWKFVAGQWVHRPSGGRQVLAQVVETQPWAVALLEEKKFDDVDVAVRFRPISGKEDASGGIILRARDGRNYLLVRANALEGNFRLYYYDRGRHQLASASVKAPALGQWHAVRLVAVGNHMQAWLDGRLYLDHHDSRFKPGRVGLWTKTDSVTAFDDLIIRGVAGG